MHWGKTGRSDQQSSTSNKLFYKTIKTYSVIKVRGLVKRSSDNKWGILSKDIEIHFQAMSYGVLLGLGDAGLLSLSWGLKLNSGNNDLIQSNSL